LEALNDNHNGAVDIIKSIVLVSAHFLCSVNTCVAKVIIYDKSGINIPDNDVLSQQWNEVYLCHNTGRLSSWNLEPQMMMIRMQPTSLSVVQTQIDLAGFGSDANEQQRTTRYLSTCETDTFCYLGQIVLGVSVKFLGLSEG